MTEYWEGKGKSGKRDYAGQGEYNVTGCRTGLKFVGQRVYKEQRLRKGLGQGLKGVGQGEYVGQIM